MAEEEAAIVRLSTATVGKGTVVRMPLRGSTMPMNWVGEMVIPLRGVGGSFYDCKQKISR